MIEKMSNYILDNMLIKDEKVSNDERETLLFGVTRILEDIPKYTFIIILCAVLKILPELGVAFLTTLCYKLFIGGAHAKTNAECFVYSTLYFILPILFAKYIVVPNIVSYVIYTVVFIFSLYVILKIAPADTDQIPIINKKLRKNLRLGALISIMAIFIFSFLFLKNVEYRNIIMYTVMLIDIMATKPMYKFLKCKYSYESDEFKQYFNN